MKGAAYIFRRKLGFPLPKGGTTGHVGWAFQLDESGAIQCGATENPRMLPWVPVGGDNGWWSQIAVDLPSLEKLMRDRLYDDYKTVPIEQCFPDNAMQAALNSKEVGYSFTGNHCLDHAFHVVAAYGWMILPLPVYLPTPNAWFSALDGEYRSLKD